MSSPCTLRLRAGMPLKESGCIWLCARLRLKRRRGAYSRGLLFCVDQKWDQRRNKNTLYVGACALWQRCRCRRLCLSDLTKTVWDLIYVFRVCCHTADDGGRGVFYLDVVNLTGRSWSSSWSLSLQQDEADEWQAACSHSIFQWEHKKC